MDNEARTQERNCLPFYGCDPLSRAAHTTLDLGHVPPRPTLRGWGATVLAPRVDGGKLIMRTILFLPGDLFFCPPPHDMVSALPAFRSNGGVRTCGAVEQDAGAPRGGPGQRPAARRCHPQRRHGLSWKVRRGDSVILRCDGVIG